MVARVMLSLDKLFDDRRDAGRMLAQVLLASGADFKDGVVLGLPRGGVPVACEVARALHLPLDVFIVRKLGVPSMGELAMGAIASDGTIALNHGVIEEFQIPQQTIDAVAEREKLEIKRREQAYRGGRPPLPIADRTVIVVDDGVATGASMLAAARALRRIARKVIIAVPVVARGTYDELSREADTIFCPQVPRVFYSVGGFYANFDQTTDEEVRACLLEASVSVTLDQ